MTAITFPRGKSMCRSDRMGRVSIGEVQIADFDKIGHSDIQYLSESRIVVQKGQSLLERTSSDYHIDAIIQH